jgi:hypothetical protein
MPAPAKNLPFQNFPAVAIFHHCLAKDWPQTDARDLGAMIGDGFLGPRRK